MSLIYGDSTTVRYAHSKDPRLVAIDGQLVDMHQTYCYDTATLLQELPDVAALQLSYLQWRHQKYEDQFGLDGPPDGYVRCVLTD